MEQCSSRVESRRAAEASLVDVPDAGVGALLKPEGAEDLVYARQRNCPKLCCVRKRLTRPRLFISGIYDSKGRGWKIIFQAVFFSSIFFAWNCRKC